MDSSSRQTASTPPPRRAVARAQRRRRSTGAVMVEYAFLLVGFCVPVMTAAIAGGVRMVKGYSVLRNTILLKGP